MTSFFSRPLAAIADRLLKPSSLSDVTFGVLIFLIIKVLLISAGTVSHKTPRAGDDSFVYLWFAKSNLTNDLYNSRGVRSLESQAKSLNQKVLSQNQQNLLYTASWRVTGHSPSFAASIFAKLEATKLSFYQMFWVQEFVGVLLLAFALWLLFSHPSRPRGLLLLIPLMATARFPGQGLHFLVPSVFSLAFGMMIWSIVGQTKAKPVLMFLTTAGALFSHLIGVVHGGVAAILVALRWLLKQITFRRAMLESSILLAALATFALFKFSNIAQPKIGPSSFSIGFDNFFVNLVGTMNLTWKFAHHDPAVTFLVILGAVYIFTKLERSNFYWLTVSTLLVVVLSLFAVTTIQIDGEVPRRILVPIFIVFLAFAANSWSSVFQTLRNRLSDTHSDKLRIISGLAFSALVVGSLVATTVHAKKNLAYRWPQLDRFGIAKSLNNLPANSHILYGETDMAMMASFLAGGYKYQSSAWPFLETIPKIGAEWFKQNRPDHLVFLMPRELQPEAVFRGGFTNKRDYGFRLNDSRTLKVTLPRNSEKVFLKIPSAHKLTIKDKYNCKYQLLAETKPSWFSISPQQCQSDDTQQRVKIIITGDGFVAGIRYGAIAKSINWPWGSNTEIEMTQEKWFSSSKKRLNYSFEWQKVFAKSGLKSLYRTIDKPFSLMSDQNGLLIMKLSKT